MFIIGLLLNLFYGCNNIFSSIFGKSESTVSKINFNFNPSNIKYIPNNEKDIEPIRPNEVIWLDISKKFSGFNRKTLTAGDNELELNKNGIYMVGFVDNPVISRSKSPHGRTIGTSIQTIGNLEIVTAGLGSIPLSQSSQDKVELGELSLNSSSYSSDINLQYASDALGYSSATLLDFGVFDPSLYMFLNPDINKNGIYDEDENLHWKLQQMRYLCFHPGDIKTDWSIQNPVSDYVVQHNLIFSLGDGFEHLPRGELFLRFPRDREYSKYGIQIYGTAPFSFNDTSNEFDEYYFSLLGGNDNPIIPRPPFNGDYELEIGSKTYYFSNLEFPGGDEGPLDGYTFPALRFTVDDKDNISRITCRWKKAQGTSYIDASPEEVKLRFRDFRFDFGNNSNVGGAELPSYFDVNFYDGFDIDVSALNLEVSGFPSWGLACSYWDVGDTLHRIEYHME